jgi:hypothetical protein
MRWITCGGPEPLTLGWYPTVSRWPGESACIIGAHRWLGTEWSCAEPEVLICFYDVAYDDPCEARKKAHELDGCGEAKRLGLVEPSVKASSRHPLWDNIVAHFAKLSQGGAPGGGDHR